MVEPQKPTLNEGLRCEEVTAKVFLLVGSREAEGELGCDDW